MDVKFIYELTGRSGTNLYGALEEHHFNEIFALESKYYFEESDIGKTSRSCFIDWLEKDLSAQTWREMKESVACDDLSAWLLQNPIPDREEELREKYAEEETRFQFETFTKGKNEAFVPLYLDHIDLDDDAEIALFFKLITFPSRGDDGRYLEHRNERQIPADTANLISELMNEANGLAKTTGRYVGSPPPKDDLERAADEKINSLYTEASRLEKEAVLSLVRIAGFACEICGGTVRYTEPILKVDLSACPSCGHPICPFCANCYDEDPTTVEEAAAYLASCDEVAGMAYCGYCGDWGTGFMLRFLHLKNCPIPKAYRNHKPVPRYADYITTRTVAGLPEINQIAAVVQKAFMQGTSGIIKVQHPTGEIWGIPERHPDGWKVTICYPKER